MDNLIEIAPSILPADFAILAEEIKKWNREAAKGSRAGLCKRYRAEQRNGPEGNTRAIDLLKLKLT